MKNKEISWFYYLSYGSFVHNKLILIDTSNLVRLMDETLSNYD